jgi:transposase
MNNPLLTVYQRRKIRQLLRDTTDARLYQRLLALLEVDRGKPVSEVARLLNVSAQTIYNWIGRYSDQGDMAALADQYGVGRPTVWTEERSELLETLMQTSPQNWGYFAVDWTVPLLQEQIVHSTGQHFSEDTIRRELHRLGYVWKRGRYTLLPDPELEKKTADSPKSPAFAASKRSFGRRRNRPVALPASQGQLVQKGASSPSAD